MSREDVIILQRVQPFVAIDHEILKECRKRGPAAPDMLLTYFVLQEMDSKNEWFDDVTAELKLAELSGLDHPTVSKILNEFDSMGVFNEEG